MLLAFLSYAKLHVGVGFSKLLPKLFGEMGLPKLDNDLVFLCVGIKPFNRVKFCHHLSPYSIAALSLRVHKSK